MYYYIELFYIPIPIATSYYAYQHTNVYEYSSIYNVMYTIQEKIHRRVLHRCIAR